MAESGKLSPAQRRAIAALLVNRDNRAAAAAAGVGERSLARWLTLPHFRAALASAEDDILSASARRLLSLQNKAADRLEQVLDTAPASSPLGLRAAQLAHEAGFRAIELSRLAQRVADLEARLEANNAKA